MQSGNWRATRPDSWSPEENPAAVNVWVKLAPVGPASTRLCRTFFSTAQGSASWDGWAWAAWGVCARAGRAPKASRAKKISSSRRLMSVLQCNPAALQQRGRGNASQRRLRSMPEMPSPREHHRHARLVGRRDHLVVPLAAARLDHGRDARLDEHVEAVAEGEEGVRGGDAAGHRE